MEHFQVARSSAQHLLCEAEHARGVKAGGGELPDHWKLLLPPYRNCPTGGEKIHTDNSFQTQKMLKKIAGQFFFMLYMCTCATFRRAQPSLDQTGKPGQGQGQLIV